MADGLFSLAGRTAVVVGGLGKIGVAVTKALADQGARTVVLDVAEAAWREQKAGLTGDGRRVEFRSFDATDVTGSLRRIGELDQDLGGIDVWVNCAYPKVAGWASATDDASLDALRRNVDAQLIGPCLFAEAIAPLMAKRRRGSIIAIGSTYGVVSPDFSIYEGLDMGSPSAYSMVKGGLLMHARFLAGKFGRQGVRANMVCPGGIEADQPAIFKERYSNRTMLGRMGRGEDIGGPVAFLASDAASYVTGTVLMADGGWTAM